MGPGTCTLGEGTGCLLHPETHAPLMERETTWPCLQADWFDCIIASTLLPSPGPDLVPDTGSYKGSW